MGCTHGSQTPPSVNQRGTEVNRSTSEVAQPNHFRAATVPGLMEFLVVNELEAKRVRANDKLHEQRRASIAAGTAYIEPQTEEQKRKSLAIEDENYKNAPQYESNRARIAFATYENGKMDNNETERMLGGFPMECRCTLEEDGSIHLESFFWLFGGLALRLNLYKSSSVTGSYWEDQHKQPIFKTKLTDPKLVDNVQVPLEKRDVVFTTTPRFELGEALTGQLTFKTTDYYRSAEYEQGFSKEEGYSDLTMDTMYATGALNFTCQLVSPSTYGLRATPQ
jgi:hypothetical protein